MFARQTPQSEWVCALQKLITFWGRFDTYKGEVKDGFINISDMLLVTGNKGGVHPCGDNQVK